MHRNPQAQLVAGSCELTPTHIQTDSPLPFRVLVKDRIQDCCHESRINRQFRDSYLFLHHTFTLVTLINTIRRALRSLLERHVGPFTKSQTELFARAKIYQLKQRTSVTKYIEFENLQAKIDATTEAEAILVIGPSQDIRHL